ncbi:helix-turn-helix transcriptional regulator [Streptomyces sp. NPDC050703]|uniref:helix-turn-helix domain-containing protein n=1 Tax=Streptomyces sp. NPDC050703 TaxID=3157218 RepID=UPI00343699FA
MTNDLFASGPNGLGDRADHHAPCGTDLRDLDPRAPEATFAAVLRQALRQRGLSLERVCDRLHAQGISVSPATLSHWQRGRSQPERPQSLRAIDALEPMLGLSPGTLRSLLGPHRPRGRALPHDPAAVRGVYGERSDLEQALGEAFPHFNSDTQALVTHETVTLDEHRSIREMTVTTVLRAVRDGARQLTVVHFLDALPDDAVDVVVRNGELTGRRFVPELRSVLADISFGRPLARNDTAVVEYTVHIGPSLTASTSHERRIRGSLRTYLLHVRFHPLATPSSCHYFYRERLDGEARQRHRVLLDTSHTAHLLPAKCPPGVYGLEWQWE